MKYKILFCLFLFTGKSCLYAQNSTPAAKSMIVSITQENGKFKISVSIDTPLQKQANVDLTRVDTFIVDNKTNTDDFKLFLAQTTGGDADTAVFTGNEIEKMKRTSYKIKDSMIVQKSFSLKSNFNILLKNRQGDILNAGIILRPRFSGEGPKELIKVIGIPVYDAILLANNINGSKQKMDSIMAILSFYANQKVAVSIDSLKKLYAGNNFITSYLNTLPAADKSAIASGQTGEKTFNFLSSALSSAGGLDVTNIADGLARFLVKRTKQELNIAFFDKFKKFISKYQDLRTVFPETYKALSILGDEIYNYQAYIQTLRESFENDLRTLDKNLPSIIDNHKAFFNARPALEATLLSGCYIAGALDDKVHPGDILSDYPTAYLKKLNTNWQGSIQTLQLISASLRDTTQNTDSVYWVSSKQIRELVKDKAALKIYLGLIVQQAKNNYDDIHYNYRGKDTTLVGLLNTLAETNIEKDYDGYKDFITQFSEKAGKLNAMVKNYKKPVNDSLAFQQYYNYFNASIDLLQHCAAVSKLKYIDSIVPGLADSLKDYFDVARSSSNLVLDVKRRNYASAVVNAVHIYDLVKAKHNLRAESDSLNDRQIKKANKRTEKAVTDLVNKTANGDGVINSVEINNLKKNNFSGLKNKTRPKGSELKEVNKQIAAEIIKWAATNPTLVIDKNFIDSLRKLKLYYNLADDTLKKLYKYGTFMATMVEAKSSDDVEKAIEAFALPTGSARIKRETAFNVSLNAYTGLFTGYEKIKGVDNNCWKFNSYGVTAPVGVAVSWGHRFLIAPTKAGWSTSLFVSLVDVGTVAAFRFNDDSTVISNNNTKDTLTTSQSPSIQLKHIVSPGLFLSIGIPKCPLSVNFGAQMGTNLRKITSSNSSTQIDYSDKMYWRYSISVCVDIPVLNFYTRSK